MKSTFKKIFLVSFVTAVLSLVFCLSAGALDIEEFWQAEEKTSGDYVYIITKDKTAAIKSYKGKAANIKIPEKLGGKNVTIICNGAFADNKKLQSVEFSKNITEIHSVGKDIGGYGAFKNCTNLKKVVLNDGLKIIGAFSFSGCKKLTDIKIPDSVTSVGGEAFFKCEKLTSLDLPEGVASIPYRTFSDCTNLKKIGIPKSVSDIVYEAFSDCTSLENVTIPGNVGYLAHLSFKNCKNLETVTIENGVTEIGGSAFDNCTSLKRITIPSSVTKIHSAAFRNCTSLKNIKIPESVTEMGEDAIFNTGYYNDPSNWDGNALYYKNDLIGINTTKNTNVIIKEGTSKISTSLRNNKKLTSVTIPSTVKDIPWNCFENCTSLKTVNIKDGVTYIGDSAFYGCKALSSITLPDSISSIGSAVFENCDSLESIVIPEGVEDIRWNTFANCTSLKDVTLPSTITYIDESAFDNTLVYDAEAEGVIYLGNIAFTYGGDKENLTEVIINEGTTLINQGLFSDCEYLESVVLPESLITIGDNAFTNCYSLEEIVIPENVTSIGRYAFTYCNSLNKVNLPEKLEYIGDAAFRDCDKLKDITIPSSVTFIGEEAFGNTAWFKNQPQGLMYINNVLYGCNGQLPKNTTLTVKDGTTIISGNALSNQKNLVKVIIPDGVTFIGSSAFSNCSSLESITIPDSVTEAEDFLFGCKKLSTVYYYGTKAQWDKVFPGDMVYWANENAKIQYHYGQKHTYKSEVTTPATYTANGVKTFTCTNCDDKYEKKISRKKLQKVTGLKVKSKKSTSVTLSWKKTTGAESYIVSYSTNGKKWKSVSTKKASYTVKKLKKNTKYQFKVKAVAGKYSGKASSVVKTVTKK